MESGLDAYAIPIALASDFEPFVAVWQCVGLQGFKKLLPRLFQGVGLLSFFYEIAGRVRSLLWAAYFPQSENKYVIFTEITWLADFGNGSFFWLP